MLVKNIYLIILFFFLQDVIELIVWFCVGYFYGHVFFYAFIKAKKKNPRKDITDFFEKYKQKMAEKPSLVDEFQSLLKIDETEKPSSVEEKERVDPGKEFLIKLDQKVSAKFKDCIIEIDVSEKVLRFSFETHVLRSRVLAEKLIDTVDDHLKKEFFSPNGLAQFGWCAKYMLYSDFSVKLPNRLKTQVVQFIWFRNLYRHKLCPCFICDSFKSKYDCQC